MGARYRAMEGTILASLFDDRSLKPEHFDAQFLIDMFNLMVDRLRQSVLDQPIEPGFGNRARKQI